MSSFRLDSNTLQMFGDVLELVKERNALLEKIAAARRVVAALTAQPDNAALPSSARDFNRGATHAASLIGAALGVEP